MKSQSHITRDVDNPLVLTMTQCARRLQIGRTTLRSLIAAGKLRTILAGKHPRIPIESLYAFVAAQTVDAGLCVTRRGKAQP